MADVNDISEWSWYKLGFVGAVLVVLVRTIKFLWDSGRADAEKARGERDALLRERETLRIAHTKEMSDCRIEHAQELHRVREECHRLQSTETQRYMEDVHALRENLSEEKIAFLERQTTRQEAIVREITTVTQSLDTTLSKVFDRIRPGG